MERRVVITGMGAVTPIGNTVKEFWDGLINGRSGIGTITRFDTENFEVKIAAEVKNFNPELYMQKKDVKRMDLYCQFGLAAASQAMDDSGLDVGIIDKRRFGVIVGSGIGGLGTIEEQVVKLSSRGAGKVSPLFIPMAIGNMAAGNIAIKYGAKGVCMSVTTACASGANSIGEAYRNIQQGYADVIISGGAEASITGIAIAGFTNIQALTNSNDPLRASIPFDKERSGFVMGEGAGAIVLEELEHAKQRSATIYGEIVGYGTSCDAYHMTSPSPDGEGATVSMQNALRDANLSPEEIGYINAHGTSTPANDKIETLAIKNTFKEAAYNIPVSSTKSMTGHLLGASGAIEAIACILAVKEGIIPPTIGYKAFDEECDLNYVPNTSIKKEIKYAISDSLGFGGHNATLCFKRWEG